MNPARMSRIEIVMHLQAVDLFRSCAATDVVRLAQIAEPSTLAAEEVVFRPTEPSRALYTVVSGRVVVEGPQANRREVGPRSSFGVREILSGRQRRSRAEALEESLILSIEAEDFFDLLSNNIDIVKALFREILDEAAAEPADTGLQRTADLLESAVGRTSDALANVEQDGEPEGVEATHSFSELRVERGA